MSLDLITKIIIWILIWLAGWGFYLFYLVKKGVNYFKQPVLSCFYFFAWTVLVLLAFKEYLITFTKLFTVTPFVVMVIVLAITPWVYFVANKKLKKPVKLIKQHSLDFFLRLDYRFLFPKFFELLFQQTMILVLIAFLAAAGINLIFIFIIFLAIFSLIHIPLLRVEGTLSAKYFIISAFVASIAFPLLIVKINFGFVYSYTLHWLYYLVSALFFWIYYEKSPHKFESRN